MNILALDTSSEALVVGVQTAERRFETFEIVRRSHSRDVLPAIMQLLEPAGIQLSQLDLIVYGQGPGSFTGLRIAVGVVQGLAYGLDIPVAPVSSLACLAQSEYRRTGNERMIVALTARRQEVFFGVYEIVDGLATLVGREAVVDVESLAAIDGDDWVGVGSGWQLQDKLEVSLGVAMKTVDLEAWPRADDLLDLGLARYARGDVLEAPLATPEYLREQVATPNPAAGR